MYIVIQQKNGVPYATLTESIRNGKKVTKKYTNLGRVLDKERGIYQNRKLGVFTYDPKTNTYGTCPDDFVPPKKTRRSMYYTTDRKHHSLLILRFGDIFFFDSFLKKENLYPCIDAVGYGNKDTLHALIAYYSLSSLSNSHAEDWFELSYAKVLYKNAVLSSQRISEALAKIGMEENRRSFFKEYYKFVLKCQMNDTKGDYGLTGTIDDAILVDSCGLPNDAALPVTGVNNHNGIISNELRVIYAVQHKTGLPLFFRYAAGNVIDANTIKRTVFEMKGLGINTKFALLDSGYYNGKNADTLIEAGISFISRVPSHHNIYKNAVSEKRKTLESKENMVIHNRRVYYIEEVRVKIGEKKDKDAYGYLCLDTTMRYERHKKMNLQLVDEEIQTDELYETMQNSGLFMLVCTRRVEKKYLLGLYYTRNQVEELFRIGKGIGKWLPIQIESEETLRGHLLITFITSVISKILMDQLIGTGMTPEHLYSVLQYQSVQIFQDYLLTSEPVKKMNDIYKHFKITCPDTIPYQPTSDELSRMHSCG